MKLIKILTENVETEKPFFLGLLKQLYPSFPQEHDSIINKLIQAENMLHDESLKVRSKIIIKYLNENPERPQEPPSHVKDRIFNDLKKIIIVKNKEYYISRYKSDKYSKISSIFKKELPETKNDELLELIDKFISTGKNIDYIYSFIDEIVKKQTTKSKLIAQLNNLSLFKLEWEESEILETHIDNKTFKEKVHRLLVGTSVCVRFKEYFEDYSKHSPIYLINKLNKPYIIITHDETKTSENENITDEQFAEIKEIISKDYLCKRNLIRYYITHCTNEKILNIIYEESKEDLLTIELLASSKYLPEKTSNEIYDDVRDVNVVEILAECSPHDSIINKILLHSKTHDVIIFLLRNKNLSKQSIEKIFNIYKNIEYKMSMINDFMENELFDISYVERLFKSTSHDYEKLDIIKSFRLKRKNAVYNNFINDMIEFLDKLHNSTIDPHIRHDCLYCKRDLLVVKSRHLSS